MNPINVRVELLKAPLPMRGKSLSCYVGFQLIAKVWVNEMWQGGETIQVKRVGENEFKVGCLPIKSLDEMTSYIEEWLDRYRVPYVKSSGSSPRHPFAYQI